MYKITINKYEPLTEEEQKSKEEKRDTRNRYNEINAPFYPPEMGLENMKFIRALDVALTDAQFEAVKKAVLAEM